MKLARDEDPLESVPLRVDVVVDKVRSRPGALRCVEGINLKFDFESMVSYFYSKWEPILYDALLLAATVEFCDRVQRRGVHKWRRCFDIRIPVHNPNHWNHSDVKGSLYDALGFLTGDSWSIDFTCRKKPVPQPQKTQLVLGNGASTILPFSNGLDSHVVAYLMERVPGNHLIKVRLKTRENHNKSHSEPFSAIPFVVDPSEFRFYESSARSRGFKFTLVSGLAAYLAEAKHVIIPESGQGSIGPVLIPVGQAYEDYRSYPLFTVRMEKFLKALLGYDIVYKFPQIWKTKGETLTEYITTRADGSLAWTNTRSCWQQNRQVSVNRQARQCGICAACMLRRQSVHAAGLSEPKTTYVWENLGASTFEEGVALSFGKQGITRAMREYAIAGALHLAHLARLSDSQKNDQMLALRASQLSKTLGLPLENAKSNLARMLLQHKIEWENFMNILGPNSFVARWSRQAQP